MKTFVIDAYAWIEYFDGSKQGEKVKAIVENFYNRTYTNTLTIAELSSFFTRKSKSFDEPKKIIFSLSTHYPIDLKFAEEAGILYAKVKKERKNMSLADVFVLLTAQRS